MQRYYNHLANEAEQRLKHHNLLSEWCLEVRNLRNFVTATMTIIRNILLTYCLSFDFAWEIPSTRTTTRRCCAIMCDVMFIHSYYSSEKINVTEDAGIHLVVLMIFAFY